VWWIVFRREVHELWVGGKAPILLLVYTVLLGVMTYVMASNSELSLIPPQEMVYETLKGAFAYSLFILMVVGADAISGERERATLESLLLTPTSRRQIMIGKFLACVTPWPAALLICIPYLHAISQGNVVFQHAVVWGAITGTLLVPAFAGIGMLASFWSNSNKSSYFVALAFYVLFMAPTTLPGRASKFWSRVAKMIGVKVLAIAACASLLLASPARAQGGDAAATTEHIPVNPIHVTLDLGYVTVKAGDPVKYNSVLTNPSDKPSPPLCVAMNIVNLNAAGDIVDPEDWSPQRTQYIETLAPGASATLPWHVNAILDGDYLIYMVVIPEPSEQNATSNVVASSGIHLTVTKFTKLNPMGILPYAIGGPLLLVLGIVWLARRRKAEVDAGATT
jgi:hypothetical protein